MNNNTFLSPFFVYILGFITLFAFYFLHWSELYPEISSSLLIFILGTCFLMSFMGGYFFKKKFFVYSPSTSSEDKLIKWSKWYLYANLLEIIYSRHVPLISGLMGEDIPDDIDFFGIPMFHIFVLSFGSFLSLLIFYKMRSDKKSRKKLFFWFLVSFISPIMIYGRGIMFMTLTGCLFIYLMSLQRLKGKLIFITLVVLTILFTFGVFGDIRISASDSRFTNKKNGVSIMEIGKATQEFQESWIPHEYMWGYIYIISPIGNLQHNINESEFVEIAPSDLWELFSMEMISATISKRIVEYEKRQEDLVIPNLNVSTVYARPYVIMGWWGMILIFVFTICYILTVFMIIPRSSEYFVVSVAIVNVILVYNLFDNMFSYGGYANVILIPIILSFKGFIKRLQNRRENA